MSEKPEPIKAPEPIDAATLTSLLVEHREGRRVLVDYAHAAACLRALGRPLAAGQVRELPVEAFTLGGRSVAPLADFVTAADALIARAARRPNLKVAAAAAARASRKAG